MQPEGSLQCSQKPASGPYEPDASNPHLPTVFPYLGSFMHRSSEWSLPFRFTNKNIVCISHLSHLYYMPHSFHPPWFYHPNIWWSVQVTKLLIMQLSPTSPSSSFLGLLFI